MSIVAPGAPSKVLAEKAPHHDIPWRALLPIAVSVLLAILPAPAGLPQHAWYFFAIFAGVIVGLMVEPLPGGAVGLIGVTTSCIFGYLMAAGRGML